MISAPLKNRLDLFMSYCLCLRNMIEIVVSLLTIKRQRNLLWNRERWPHWCYSILGSLDTGRCRLQWRGRAGLWSAAPSVGEAFRAPDNRPASWMPSRTVSITTKKESGCVTTKEQFWASDFVPLFLLIKLTINNKEVISKRRKSEMPSEYCRDGRAKREGAL